MYLSHFLSTCLIVIFSSPSNKFNWHTMVLLWLTHKKCIMWILYHLKRLTVINCYHLLLFGDQWKRISGQKVLPFSGKEKKKKKQGHILRSQIKWKGKEHIIHEIIWVLVLVYFISNKKIPTDIPLWTVLQCGLHMKDCKIRPWGWSSPNRARTPRVLHII